jgi:hypothetical protein
MVKLDPGLDKDRCATVALDNTGIIDVAEMTPDKPGSAGGREQS